MDNVTFRRRNPLKKHFVITSNVLLFGYPHVSDSAKVTYQVIDSFDWQDGHGTSNGPSRGTAPARKKSAWVALTRASRVFDGCATHYARP